MNTKKLGFLYLWYCICDYFIPKRLFKNSCVLWLSGIWNMENMERNKVLSNQAWYWHLSWTASSKNFFQSYLPGRSSTLKKSDRECMCSKLESCLPWLVQTLTDWTPTSSGFQLWPFFLSYLGILRIML